MQKFSGDRVQNMVFMFITSHSRCRTSPTQADQTCLYACDTHKLGYGMPTYAYAGKSDVFPSRDGVNSVFRNNSSKTDHSVNAQVLLWLLCDCYSGNQHSLQNLQAK